MFYLSILVCTIFYFSHFWYILKENWMIYNSKHFLYWNWLKYILNNQISTQYVCHGIRLKIWLKQLNPKTVSSTFYVYVICMCYVLVKKNSCVDVWNVWINQCFKNKVKVIKLYLKYSSKIMTYSWMPYYSQNYVNW